MTTDRIQDREAPKAFRDDEQTIPAPVIRGVDGEALGPGRVLDARYTLVERIGVGGWGEVWRAQQNSTKRDVALKILRRDVAEGEGAKERFQLEAEAVSRLVHQNTVTLFDFGRTEGGDTYMAMELLEGSTLDQVLRREGPMDPVRAIRVVRQVALSLDEAHGKGIIHRDVKPHNIMLLQRPGEPDFAKVLDFGVAKWVLQDHQLTTTGTTFGTPEYMSPEQVQSKPLDHRTDLYSLGIILYTLLVAAPPFRGESPITVAMHHINRRLPPLPGDRQIPRAVERLLHRLTAKDPTRRPFSAVEVAEICDKILRDLDAGTTRPQGRRGAWLALLAGLLLGTAAIAIWSPWEAAKLEPPDPSREPATVALAEPIGPGKGLPQVAPEPKPATTTPDPSREPATVAPLVDVLSEPADVAPEVELDIGAEAGFARPTEEAHSGLKPLPQSATITITSRIPGAVAHLPGGERCPCPCRVERPVGERLRVTVRALDHEPRRMTLKFRGGRKSVPARLTPVPLSERDGLKGDEPPSATDGLK